MRLGDGLPLAKPEPHKRVKARRKRAEKAVKDQVRADCVARDGYCRFKKYGMFGPCQGPSEWSHLVKRSQTRGQAPERRHSTRTSVMNCKYHHGQVESGDIKWRPLTAAGADGRMRWIRWDFGWSEPA